MGRAGPPNSMNTQQWDWPPGLSRPAGRPVPLFCLSCVFDRALGAMREA
jgi:hypothetical protein